MIARHRGFSCAPSLVARCFVAALQLALLHQSASAINIVVDYRYDTNNFFNTTEKRSAIEAAASRYSAIITTSLSAVTLADANVDPRIGFTHPGTGAAFQVSSATSSASDILFTTGVAAAADVYRGSWSIDADQWILYVGGRPLSPNGVTSQGGTRTGSNLNSVYLNSASHINRGFRQSFTIGQNLPVWGGSVTFDSDGSTIWHYNHTTAPAAGAVDLYTLALHEIGHALGLNTSSWLEWTSHIAPNTQQFSGQAVAAYNADNGTTRSTLNVHAASPLNPHWQDNAYDAFIFENAGPNLIGTAGVGALQDLLLEPNLSPPGRRLELTNVDVAALRDVGWSSVPQLNTLPGDFTGNGIVDAADYLVLSKGLANGSYATWRANFGETSAAPSGAAAPEPMSVALLSLSFAGLLATMRIR